MRRRVLAQRTALTGVRFLVSGVLCGPCPLDFSASDTLRLVLRPAREGAMRNAGRGWTIRTISDLHDILRDARAVQKEERESEMVLRR